MIAIAHLLPLWNNPLTTKPANIPALRKIVEPWGYLPQKHLDSFCHTWLSPMYYFVGALLQTEVRVGHFHSEISHRVADVKRRTKFSKFFYKDNLNP
jgi:hypothetical protein